MALSLKDLKSSANTLPPRILIHGAAGIGKTTLAAEFPAPVLLQTEEGIPGGMEIPTFELLSTYGQVMEAMAALATEEHDRQTVILDSLDALEPLVWRETCVRNGNWDSIETPSYGKGYLAADAVWQEFLAACNYLRRERKMTIILIAHSAVSQFEAPGMQPYSRYDLRLHKRGAAIFTDNADHIFFVNTKVMVKEVDAGFNKKHAHAEGSSTRYIFTDAKPAYIAKNRAQNMPAEILFTKGKGFEALAPHLFPSASPPKEAAKPSGKGNKAA